MRSKVTRLATVAALGSMLTVSSLMADTFDAVMKKGAVNCGVSTGVPGFSAADSKGVWKGVDVDVCRAVAAAVLGDASKVKYVPLTAKERFTALQSGEIDVLSRNTTWTLTRDSSLGLNFAGVNYYDGQGFMVSKKLGVTSALQLDGASVCVQTGTTTELNLSDYFRANKMEYKIVPYDTSDQTIKGFEAGRCDMITSDQSQLYALRSKMKDPNIAVVLPEVISKEPLGPVVRQGDDKWFNIVKWSMFALVEAEEKGVTMKNADAMMKSNDPGIKRLLGVEGKLGADLGLPKDFGYKIVKQVGNYGESFEANIGINTPLQIKRGLNALWTKGGLMYAPPFR